METSTTTAASKDGSNAGEGETTQLSPASEDGSSGCNDPGFVCIFFICCAFIVDFH